MSTHKELFEIALGEALAASAAGGEAISETMARTPGSTLWWELNAIAAAGSEVSFQAIQRFKSTFLDTAEDDALRRWVVDRYNFAPLGATSGIVELTVTRTTSTGDLTISAGKGVRSEDSTVTFAFDYDLVIPNGSLTGTGTATSTSQGASQQAKADKLTVWVGGPPESGATVTNPEKAAGANNAETADHLRERARSYWVNSRRGTLGALTQGALAVAQVREATAYDNLDSLGRETGWSTVVVADENGDSNTALETAVDQALVNWEPAGIFVEVIGGNVLWRDIDLTAVFEAGAATADRLVAVKYSVVATVNGLDPNGAATAAEAPESSWLSPGLIDAAARSVGRVVHVIVNDPVADEAPERGYMIRTDIGRVKVNGQ